MTKYYIFRHGQTFNSKFHLPYPKNNKSVEILPEGIPALERLAGYLKNIKSNHNFSSEYLRCQQTTKIIAGITGLQFEKDARLNEFNQETFSEFVNRTKNFLEEVEKNEYQTVVICTHGAGISTIKNLLIKGRVKRRELPFYPKPGILMCIEGEKIQKIDFR